MDEKFNNFESIEDLEKASKEDLFYFSKTLKYMLEWHDVFSQKPDLGDIVRVSDGEQEAKAKLVKNNNELEWVVLIDSNMNIDNDDVISKLESIKIEFWQYIIPTPMPARKFSDYIH